MIRKLAVLPLLAGSFSLNAASKSEIEAEARNTFNSVTANLALEHQWTHQECGSVLLNADSITVEGGYWMTYDLPQELAGSTWWRTRCDAPGHMGLLINREKMDALLSLPQNSAEAKAMRAEFVQDTARCVAILYKCLPEHSKNHWGNHVSRCRKALGKSIPQNADDTAVLTAYWAYRACVLAGQQPDTPVQDFVLAAQNRPSAALSQGSVIFVDELPELPVEPGLECIGWTPGKDDTAQKLILLNSNCFYATAGQPAERVLPPGSSKGPDTSPLRTGQFWYQTNYKITRDTDTDTISYSIVGDRGQPLSSTPLDRQFICVVGAKKDIALVKTGDNQWNPISMEPNSTVKQARERYLQNNPGQTISDVRIVTTKQLDSCTIAHELRHQQTYNDCPYYDLYAIADTDHKLLILNEATAVRAYIERFAELQGVDIATAEAAVFSFKYTESKIHGTNTTYREAYEQYYSNDEAEDNDEDKGEELRAKEKAWLDALCRELKPKADLLFLDSMKRKSFFFFKKKKQEHPVYKAMYPPDQVVCASCYMGDTLIGRCGNSWCVNYGHKPSEYRRQPGDVLWTKLSDLPHMDVIRNFAKEQRPAASPVQK